ncbi:MAG TPA: SRPBCC family protein [Sporichthyaceae bacterium]
MRYRDYPTMECSIRVAAAAGDAWALVTDISLPARFAGELQAAEWLDGATGVALGARFRGHNKHEALGEWTTESEVCEVEDGRRWVWQVFNGDGEVSASWGFEVEPGKDSTTIRQWGKMGPALSGLKGAIESMPDKEGRIVARRLEEWQAGITANLEGIRRLFA